MKTNKILLKLIINPLPMLCFLMSSLMIIKNIIYFYNYDEFFLPLIIWGTFTAIIYLTCIIALKKKKKLLLFCIYLIESCSRIIFFTTITKCDPKYEILLISFFVICYLFSTEYKTYKKTLFSVITLIALTILHTLFFKIRYYCPFTGLLKSQQIFVITETYANLVITCTQLILISSSTSLTLKKMKIKNDSTQQKLEYLSGHDILTGLMNRYRATTLFTYCETCKLNENIDYGIAILDIDDFKKINDVYGHDCGDFVLKSYTQELRKRLPAHNKIGRWGGEEFVIIFPKISQETIFELDTIRELLSLTPFHYNGQIIHVTATYGISSSKKFRSAYEVLNDADSNLLIGKENGKNRLVVSQNF